MVVIQIENPSNGRKFNVVFEVNSSSADQIVSFYDDKYKGRPGFDPKLGQYITTYSIATLVADAKDLSERGLRLDGGVPEWDVDAVGMKAVIEEGRKQLSKFAKPTRTALTDSEVNLIVMALKEKGSQDAKIARSMTHPKLKDQFNQQSLMASAIIIKLIDADVVELKVKEAA